MILPALWTADRPRSRAQPTSGTHKVLVAVVRQLLRKHGRHAV